jgi:hypothetical protein
MLLRRQQSKKSKVKTYCITMISLLILACEIWYVDSLNTRATESSRMAISQKFEVNPHPLLSSSLKEEEHNGGKPHILVQENGVRNHAHILESVCTRSYQYAAINLAQLHAKEAK